MKNKFENGVPKQKARTYVLDQVAQIVSKTPHRVITNSLGGEKLKFETQLHKRLSKTKDLVINSYEYDDDKFKVASKANKLGFNLFNTDFHRWSDLTKPLLEKSNILVTWADYCGVASPENVNDFKNFLEWFKKDKTIRRALYYVTFSLSTGWFFNGKAVDPAFKRFHDLNPGDKEFALESFFESIYRPFNKGKLYVDQQLYYTYNSEDNSPMITLGYELAKDATLVVDKIHDEKELSATTKAKRLAKKKKALKGEKKITRADPLPVYVTFEEQLRQDLLNPRISEQDIMKTYEMHPRQFRFHKKKLEALSDIG